MNTGKLFKCQDSLDSKEDILGYPMCIKKVGKPSVVTSISAWENSYWEGNPEWNQCGSVFN